MQPENSNKLSYHVVPNSADSTVTVDIDNGSYTSNAVTPAQGVLPQKTVSTYNYVDKSGSP